MKKEHIERLVKGRLVRDIRTLFEQEEEDILSLRE